MSRTVLSSVAVGLGALISVVLGGTPDHAALSADLGQSSRGTSRS